MKKLLLILMLFAVPVYAADVAQNAVTDGSASVATTHYLNGYNSTTSYRYTVASILGLGISDVAYDATSWDAVTTVCPSKNAIRDYLESKLPSGSDGSYGAVFTNNTAKSPTAATDELYFEANVLKINMNGTEYGATYTVGSGTATLGTSAIPSGDHATVVTVSASGVATTDVIDWGFNGDPHAVTGYAPSANGMLTIIAYPTTDNVNFLVVNNTGASITPGSALTLNWKVRR